MTDYMTPLEGEPVSGETVKLVSDRWPKPLVSDRWPDPVEQDWSYQTPERESAGDTSEPPTPWEEHRIQAREALRTELQQAATHSIRAAKWADIQTDLPAGLLTDIRAIAEKLRQTVKALVVTDAD